MITDQQKLQVVNNLMQGIAVYTRFVSEADQAGAFTEEIINKISKETDFPVERIKDLIEGSTEAFDDVKSALEDSAEIMKEDLKS